MEPINKISDPHFSVVQWPSDKEYLQVRGMLVSCTLAEARKKTTQRFCALAEDEWAPLPGHTKDDRSLLYCLRILQGEEWICSLSLGR